MRKSLMYLLLTIGTSPLVGQNNWIESNSVGIEETINEYLDQANDQAVLYMGKEHINYPVYIQGHPYWETSQYQEGSLLYNGLYYPQVKLRLDIYRGKLLIQPPNKQSNIVLSEKLLERAIVNDLILIYHKSDTLPGTPPEGYYVSLYEGKNKVLEKPECFIYESLKDRKVVSEFIHKSKFYIHVNDKYYHVTSKNSLLRALTDRKKELNQYIKQNHISFKHLSGETIVKVLEQYEKQNQ